MLQCWQQEIKTVFLSEFEPSSQQVNKIDLCDIRMFVIHALYIITYSTMITFIHTVLSTF